MEVKIFNQELLAKFEQIWIEENVHDKYGVRKKLSDEDYIDYEIWEDLNWKDMYAKHLPKTVVIRGKNPNLIFHGGCLGCLSQRTHGVERCKGCQYFKADWSKPNLHIEGEQAHKITGEDLKRAFGINDEE